MNESALILLTILLGIEFGLKQLFETYLENSRANPIGTYVVYRCVHLLSVILLMYTVVFTDSSLWYSILAAVLAVFIGASELLIYLVQDKLYEYTRTRYTWLYFIPVIGFVIYSVRLDPQVLLGVPYLSNAEMVDTTILTKACVFVLLSHTANYALRWLINKEWSMTLPELVVDSIAHKLHIQKSFMEATATVDGVYEQTATLRAGRTIGILERWIWLLFILLGYPSLIGFVITAKSIARFKKMEDSEFAEYYLMGTLYSALFTVLMSLLIPGVWE